MGSPVSGVFACVASLRITLARPPLAKKHLHNPYAPKKGDPCHPERASERQKEAKGAQHQGQIQVPLTVLWPRQESSSLGHDLHGEQTHCRELSVNQCCGESLPVSGQKREGAEPKNPLGHRNKALSLEALLGLPIKKATGT